MQLTPRTYQESIAETAKQHNTLVVLPTGLGKTMIAMMLADHRLRNYPSKKVVVLAPTRPLVDQHASSFADNLPDAESLSTTLTGRVAPKKRAEEWERASFIFSTPQTVENDLLARRISLEEVALLVVDEAHRATGDYSYVYIAEQYRKHSSAERLLALTASPGSKRETIQEVVDNLGVERIEVRSPEDPDVRDYVQEMDVQYDEVELPKLILDVKSLLDRVSKDRLSRLKSYGHISRVDLTKSQLLGAQRELQRLVRSGQPEPTVWQSLSILAEVMKLQHALELVETQGLSAFLSYVADLRGQAERGASKAVKSLVADQDFKAAVVKAESLAERGFEHPKFARLLSRVRFELTMNQSAKIIVFSQFRHMAKMLSDALQDLSELFVGQQKKGGTGLSQKEQKEMLARFSDGEFPVLVATSVGEEGLDIPTVDLVLFYEPVPSAIRTIQRRGRTGRHDTGRVVVLVTKGTRDEAYRWSAHHKEKRMYRELERLSKTVTPKPPKNQSSLEEFSEELEIVADTREKSSGVLKELQNLGVSLTLKSLSVGDYVLSKRVCVEFKTAHDFVSSLLDGRLMNQLSQLTQYPRPVLVVQGSNWYEQRNVHPNAIRGALAAIGVSFGVPILVSQNDKDTAALLYTIARREKEAGLQDPSYGTSRPGSDRELLVDVVASFPNVGPVLAPKLLARFGSLQRLVSAEVDDLMEVEGIGKKKAGQLHAFFKKIFEV